VNPRWVMLLAGLLLAVRPASLLDDPSLGKTRYDRCLELVKRSAGTAFDQANGWYQQDGGGAAALHCEALALIDLKRYAEAARKLEEAAKNGAVGSAPERADLLDQAGNAWLLAGQPGKADAVFSAALAFAPQDEDLLADRARARGVSKNWLGAEADLSAVLSLDPNRADALVLRASARHAQGRKVDARADIDHALELDPDYPEALLERGTMKLESGDAAGARADWQQVVTGAPGTDAAATAQARLQARPANPGKH
jgi:tetratricopeptide (TPR) repeat protein